VLGGGVSADRFDEQLVAPDFIGYFLMRRNSV
jgi:hypothetical protein